MESVQGLTQAVTTWLITHGLRIVIAVALGAAALYLGRRIVSRVFQPLVDASELEMRKRAETLRSLVRSMITATLILVTAIVVLSELGINVGPVLAAAGIVGIAVGFGAQQLVQDVISGFFILMEDQIRVGDVIETAGRSGLVESVSLRSTKLRDLAGNVHFIRNGKIDVVTNMTKDFSFYLFKSASHTTRTWTPSSPPCAPSTPSCAPIRRAQAIRAPGGAGVDRSRTRQW